VHASIRPGERERQRDDERTAVLAVHANLVRAGMPLDAVAR
jgi:hypothetical protein